MIKLKRVVGVDFSLSCPAICIYDGDPDKFNIKQCRFSYLINKVKPKQDPSNQIKANSLCEWKDNIDRYDKISDWALSFIGEPPIDLLVIEGYAFGGKGQVFNIAENTGIFKYKLFKKNKIEAYIFPSPGEVKKFISGKGGAKKEILYDIFLEETGFNLLDIFPTKSDKIQSPISDIVDSYNMCKFGINTLK